MRLEWIGHACFRLTAQDGTVIITDPYDESVGVKMIPLEADVITMSHEHHDHNETSQIIGAPVVLRGTDERQIGGVKITAVSSYHDDAQGRKRGKNAIRIFECEGLKIVHMGDQGCMPGDAALAAIAGADVMMIPVGGTYTVDAQGAKAIIERAQPQCMIPMHVKTKHCPYPIKPVWPFMALMGKADAAPVQSLELKRGCVPAGATLLQPQADTL